MEDNQQTYEMDFLRKVYDADRDSYMIRQEGEYELAKNLEQRGLVNITRSNGIMFGFPWTAASVTLKGKELLEEKLQKSEQ
jgi:hypothetical protein